MLVYRESILRSMPLNAMQMGGKLHMLWYLLYKTSILHHEDCKTFNGSKLRHEELVCVLTLLY